MGTSSSSKGSPGNVPMVPPWVPAVSPLPPAPDDATSPEATPPDAAPAGPPIVTNVPVAGPALSLPPIPNGSRSQISRWLEAQRQTSLQGAVLVI